MIFEKIPCIYYPTIVVMLDDNMSFLENIRMTIKDYENITLFDSPSTAFDFLTSSNLVPVGLDILEKIDQDEMDFDNVLSVDYEKLASFFNNENQVSVLVVDYSMPEINGVEFFEKIKLMKAKKIMLTGEADTTIALNAFNKGLIDKFLTKDLSSINLVLNDCIAEFKIKYFLDSNINAFVSSFNNIKDSCDYISIFNAWVTSNNIIKFHQIDDNGSMVGLNSSNINFYFYILNENKLQDYVNIAKENSGSDLLLQQLNQRKKIPVFLNAQNKNIPVYEWGEILHDVSGAFEFNNHAYYYCFV